MSACWDRPDMRYRITIPNKDVNKISGQVKEHFSGCAIRVGPSFYCDDRLTIMFILLMSNAQTIEERPAA